MDILRPLVSLLNAVSRRLLKIWVRTDVVGMKEAFEQDLNTDQPIFYALPHRSYSAALVLDDETRKQNLPRALEPTTINGVEFKSRVVFLSRLGRFRSCNQRCEVSHLHSTNVFAPLC